jgi:hypothetical protein
MNILQGYPLWYKAAEQYDGRVIAFWKNELLWMQLMTESLEDIVTWRMNAGIN